MSEPGAETIITPRRLPKARILVAEDDPFLRKALGSFMEDEGLEVDFAKDGQEAIDLIERHLYRLILLDLNMPFKTGFDVLKHLESKADMPIVLVFSHFDQQESKDKALAHGAREYFVKHKVDIDDLRATVRAYLRGQIH